MNRAKIVVDGIAKKSQPAPSSPSNNSDGPYLVLLPDGRYLKDRGGRNAVFFYRTSAEARAIRHGGTVELVK